MPAPADDAFPTKGVMRKTLNDFLRLARIGGYAMKVSGDRHTPDEDLAEIRTAVIIALREGKMRVGWKAEMDGMKPHMVLNWKHKDADIDLCFTHADWGMAGNRIPGVSDYRLLVSIHSPIVRA